MLYGHDARDPENGLAIEHWTACDVPDSFTEATLRLNQQSTAEELRQIYHAGVLAGTVSDFFENPADNPTYQAAVSARGFPDSFGLSASDPNGRGISVNSPCREITTLPPSTRQRWQRIGVHLKAAYRLRRQLHGGELGAEAVLEPDGTLVHAEPPATSEEARERLTRAARNIDNARLSTTRSDPDSALELWQGLVDGQWSLIDWFEDDGKRYLLAYRNEHDVTYPRGLSEREKQVIALVCTGASNKSIAYQLGITTGAVSTLLRRSLNKLGIDTRAELIWWVNSLG
jgi:DNA-binding CsgD family transcriptional regulator